MPDNHPNSLSFCSSCLGNPIAAKWVPALVYQPTEAEEGKTSVGGPTPKEIEKSTSHGADGSKLYVPQLYYSRPADRISVFAIAPDTKSTLDDHEMVSIPVMLPLQNSRLQAFILVPVSATYDTLLRKAWNAFVRKDLVGAQEEEILPRLEVHWGYSSPRSFSIVFPSTIISEHNVAEVLHYLRGARGYDYIQIIAKNPSFIQDVGRMTLYGRVGSVDGTGHVLGELQLKEPSTA